MFDLEQYIRTTAKGIDWDELQKMDHRMDDFHFVRLVSKERGVVLVHDMFKDPYSSLVWVHWGFNYILYYGKEVLQKIAKNVHTSLEFIPTEGNKGVYLGKFDFSMAGNSD